MTEDSLTASAFATSWNNLPAGSVYTREQFEDWMRPLQSTDAAGKRVLELGCGNASLLIHMASWRPAELIGVDLGESVRAAQKNMERIRDLDWRIVQEDLTAFESTGFDIVYCIGVLHHLKNVQTGFQSVVRNVRPGGLFHCWVYGKEGNALIRCTVEPIRYVVSRWPWWLTKYFVATPLAVPYYCYAKLLRALSIGSRRRFDPLLQHLPLFQYSLWIAEREFLFFRHVAFDQLVTPQTRFISKSEITRLMENEPGIDPATVYIIQRNGNSWKFGGRLKAVA
jgi:SAM-dependent methyltransferase